LALKTPPFLIAYGKCAVFAIIILIFVIDIAKKWCMIEVSTEKGCCKWREY
jgi:hypothetical protein